MIRIKKIQIHMFRIYRDEEFIFTSENGEISPLVLICGGNGKGKTTIIDAAEWCLTGDVQHLRIPFDMRCKSDTLATHSRALLKCKDCDTDETTYVKLIIDENGTETEILRSTTNNEFGSDKSSLTIIQSEKTLYEQDAEEWLSMRFESHKPIGDFFYKYYIYNSQKIEDFRRRTRREMTEEFEDFTLEHSEARQVLVNLDMINEQLVAQIKDLDNMKKESQEKLLQLEQDQQKFKESAQIPEYSQRESYPNERLDVDRISSEEQEIQLETLIAGGYHEAISWLTEYGQMKLKLVAKEQYEKNKSDIRQAIDRKLYDSKTVSNLEEQRKIITEQLSNLNDKNLEQVGEYISGLKYTDLPPNEWQRRWKEYCRLNDAWKKTESIIEEYKKGDELLTAFSRLVGVRKQIDEYRNNHKKCPLCGGEEPFASEPAELLALEAEQYVRSNDEKKLVLEEQKNKEKQEWINYQNQLKKEIEDKLKTLQTLVINELEKAQSIIENSALFFKQIFALGLTPEQFTDLELFETNIGFAEIGLDSVQAMERRISTLLDFLGYSDSEQIVTTPELVRENIRPLAQKAPIMFTFDELDLRDKIVSLRIRKGYRHLQEINKELSDKRKHYGVLDEQIKDRTTLQQRVKERANTLQKQLNNMRRNEVKEVAPYLFRIFSKLVRHTTIDGFQFEGNNAWTTEIKLTFTDNSKNPILNMISDGQLGAFILSYLLGNAFRRKDLGGFRCYFVDDIINSMDDINLVSFVDLIKYQLSESKKVDGENVAIEQFFFSTCDGNLKRMFQYKMNGFEVPITVIDLDNIS